MLSDKMTLAEARGHILNGDEISPILGAISIERTVRVRFVWNVGPLKETELRDTCSMGFFRQCCERKLAKLVIDDQGGGTGVKPRLPELV